MPYGKGTLDCRTAYCAVPLDEESIPKTAIVTQHGVWEFLRMPMGLTNACSQFAQVIHKILSSYAPEMCLPYIDDCLVFSKTIPNHIHNLDVVLGALADAGLILK